ncbi:unnamed protein product [Aureobasidium uvarum]|uniref:Uncharacterized protein n=1 Tax=Aureobasidium uvarum TaxID=2773716 RepID=A0A9N8KRA7_9PEZI|nr:unnamed protein product [Aureobasidium uvarum]
MAACAPDMEDKFLDVLRPHLARPRSKSLGDLDDRQSLACVPAALEQLQEHATLSSNRSRSACGHLYSAFPREFSGTFAHDKTLINTNIQEDMLSAYEEVQEDSPENIHEEASSPTTLQDNEDDEGENNWSSNSSAESSQDQDTSFWSNATDPRSPSTPETPTTHTEPPIPLPTPNTLTSTYLPFSSHLALTNHFTLSTLHSFVPIFLHSMLQLPCTLSTLLNLRTSEVVCRLTPAILLDHTTYLDAENLLPSLVESTAFSTYHQVQGLLYFPEDAGVVEKIGEFFAVHCKAEIKMRKATAQVEDTKGKRHDITAWAWVATAVEGEEQWWTLEDFVAGRIIGFESVEW